MDPPVARRVLAALAECWPETAVLERAVIQGSDPRRIVVIVWTSTPGEVIGRRGSTASTMKERLREAARGGEVELRVLAGSGPVDPGDHAREEASEAAMPARGLVPDLVGMTVPAAHGKARSSGFSLATGGPDGVPISPDMAHRQYEGWVVVGQDPLPGGLAPLGSRILVSIEERGGGGEPGDREPRLPRPPGGIVHDVRSRHTRDRAHAEAVE